MQYNELFDRRHFFPALKNLFSAQQLQQALDSTGLTFRNRKVSAQAVLLACLAHFVKGDSGFATLFQWLWFSVSSVATCTDQALYHARSRLGSKPFEFLRSLLTFLATPLKDPTCFYKGFRLLAFDGTTMTCADSTANRRHFGRSKNSSKKKSAYPLLRLVGLCELGSRCFVRWVCAPYRHSESKLAEKLWSAIPKNSLLIGDRAYYNARLFIYAINAGFSVLVRVQKGPKLPVQTRLIDGSYLTTVRPTRGPKRQRVPVTIRVIKYRLKVGKKFIEGCLATSLLDAEKYPAMELIEIYVKRWQIEIGIGEFKSQISGRETLLRAESPEAVRAELDGLLMGYYVVRKVALEAARQEGVDPLSISFTQVIQTIEFEQVKASPSRKEFNKKVCQRVVKPRRPRKVRRCRKTTRCHWPVKKKTDRTTALKKAKIEVISNNN